MLTVRPFTGAHAKALCAWRYPAPYAAYDAPAWETVCAQGWGISVPVRRQQEFYAVYEGEAFAGFFRAMPDGRLGLGLAPDFCGGGRGAQLMALIKETVPQRPLTLEVRSWNKRALHCYERAGFRVTARRCRAGATGPQEFYEMVLET